MRKIIKTLLTLIVSVSALSTIASAELTPSSNEIDIAALLSDVKAFTRQKTESHPWVDEIVQRYIPLHIDKEEILAVLKESGFKYAKVEKRHMSDENAEEGYIATTGFWLFPTFIFNHKFRIILNFNDNKLSRIRGRVILNHL